MRKGQGFSLSTLAFRLVLVILTGSFFLLGMLMYSSFNAGRWKASSPFANGDARANVDARDSLDKKPRNSNGSVKSQPTPPIPSESIRAPRPLSAPMDNIPYHIRYADNSTDLVQINQFYDVKVFLSREAADAFKKMQNAAESDGIYLQAVSGYRSYQDQEELFNKQIVKRGSRLEASRLSAPAGYSEHHTGYALDIGDIKNQDAVLTLSFEQTKAFRWLQMNAYAYGFELSFPKKNWMNVSYEPWHWRFVGSDAAKEIFRSARGMPQVNQSVLKAIPFHME